MVNNPAGCSVSPVPACVCVAVAVSMLLWPLLTHSQWQQARRNPCSSFGLLHIFLCNRQHTPAVFVICPASLSMHTLFFHAAGMMSCRRHGTCTRLCCMSWSAARQLQSCTHTAAEARWGHITWQQGTMCGGETWRTTQMTSNVSRQPRSSIGRLMLPDWTLRRPCRTCSLA